jgi:addiction module HigA family antidote
MSKSPNTTAKLAPVHPGAILKETLDDLGMSMNRLAQELRMPANRIGAIVAGQRAITGETALRLGRYFDTTPDYSINLQARYHLEAARDAWESRIAIRGHPAPGATPLTSRPGASLLPALFPMGRFPFTSFPKNFLNHFNHLGAWRPSARFSPAIPESGGPNAEPLCSAHRHHSAGQSFRLPVRSRACRESCLRLPPSCDASCQKSPPDASQNSAAPRQLTEKEELKTRRL